MEQPMSNDSNRADVAVFIDFENVYVSVRDKLDANPNFESIMDRCEDLGRVVIARAYADWYRYPRITSALYANGIEPMYVPTYYYDREQGRTGRAIKNSVDMNLCVDAMRTLYANPNIAKFVLATGDRDFIPLVNAIRQQGKEVIVIGIGGAASAHLAQSADEFVFYESLVGKPPATLLPDQPRAKMPEKGRESANGETAPEPEPQREPAPDIYDVLVQAIHMARERGYVCSFGSLKLLMKELTGGEFKESRYKDAAGRPFAKFKDFVLEGERRGKVQVFTSGTVNEVFLPGEDPYALSQFAQDLQEEEAAAPEPTPETPDEERAESRSAVTRRRRRRPRGGQRQAAAAASELEAAPDELEEAEDLLPPPEEPLEAEEVASGVPEEVLASDFASEEQADAVFERLLERVESEPAPPEEVLAPMEETAPGDVAVESAAGETTAGEAAVAASETAAVEPPAQPGRPFEPHEWQLLRDTMARFERPVAFPQIHDALRDARNREQIDRTNEELRSLVKQAINSGVLERIGKGTRVSYRLAPTVEAMTEAEPAEQPEQAAEPAPAAAHGAAEGAEVQPEEAPDQTAMVEQAEQGEGQPAHAEGAAGGAEVQPEEAPDQTAMVEQAEQGEGQPAHAEGAAEEAQPSEQPGDAELAFAAPESLPEAVAPELTVEPAAEAQPSEQPGDAELAFAAPESLPEAVAPELTVEPAAEEPPAKPKRTRRRTTRMP
jgi:uncharacterized protein (TIGR00288 family)